MRHVVIGPGQIKNKYVSGYMEFLNRDGRFENIFLSPAEHSRHIGIMLSVHVVVGGGGIVFIVTFRFRSITFEGMH